MLLDRYQIKKNCRYTHTHSSFFIIICFIASFFLTLTQGASVNEHETHTVNKVDREYSEDTEI